jgi:hypothetical protein
MDVLLVEADKGIPGRERAKVLRDGPELVRVGQQCLQKRIRSAASGRVRDASQLARPAGVVRAAMGGSEEDDTTRAIGYVPDGEPVAIAELRSSCGRRGSPVRFARQGLDIVESTTTSKETGRDWGCAPA